MDNQFFEKPILNSPYENPKRHWELDEQGQPTQQIIRNRRSAEFITPIPKPRKRKRAADQQQMVFDEGKGLSTQDQQYDPTTIINELRQHVDRWRSLPNPNDWQVTPETARLLQHWRHHRFNNIRPFFCQVEAVETAIWITEVAPKAGSGTQRMIELCLEAGLPEPEFEQRSGSFVITIWRDWLIAEVMPQLNLSERQRQALAIVKSQGKITNRQYREQTGVTIRTASRDLDDLVNKGVLIKKGTTGRSTFYVLGRKLDTK